MRKKNFVLLFVCFHTLFAEPTQTINNNISDTMIESEVTEDKMENNSLDENGEFQEEFENTKIEENKNIEDENLVRESVKYIKGEEQIPVFKNLDNNKTFLFLDGFWESEFKWTFGLEFFKDYTSSKIQSPVFSQNANLSLLLFMNNRWYFDVNYREKLEQVTLAAGYINIEDEIKKHVRLGNSGIKFPNYPFIKTGGGKQIAPGIMGQFGNEKWQIDTVLRYESSDRNKKIFLGKNEITKQSISISAWEKARCFLIPVNSLYGKQIEVLVKDSEHSRWRILQQDKYIIDNRKNILILNQSFPYGVAINAYEESFSRYIIKSTVKYFKNTIMENLINKDVIDSNIFLNNLNGKSYLQLKKYNTFSCFEISSIYNVDIIDSQSEIALVNKVDESVNKYFSIKQISTNIISQNIYSSDFTQIIPIGIDNEYYKPEIRFPLSKTDIHIYFEYMLDGTVIKNDENNTMQINAYNYSPVSDFVLPKETNAGDIEVIKNGIPVTNFHYNEYTNILSLHEDVLPSDKIEIRWSESKNYSDSGMVKTAIGGKWFPITPLGLFFAVSSDIGVNKNSADITDKYNISSGLDFKQGEIKTGIHLGMEANTKRNNYKYPEYLVSKNHMYFEYEKQGALLSKNEVDIFSNPRFYIDGNINKNNKAKYPSLNSSAEAAINIWKIYLGGELSLHDSFYDERNIIESYGHTVKLPIYFFYADESFFVNQNTKILSRTNKIDFEKYIHLSHLTFINYDKEFTEQKIVSSISPIIPNSDRGAFFIEAGISLNQKYKTNINLSKLNYTDAWNTSLIDLYSHGIENAKIRNEEIHFLFNWFNSNVSSHSEGFNFLGFNLDSNINAVNNADSDKTQTVSYLFKFPMSFKDVFITPLWERQTTKILKDIVSKDYKSDFVSIFESMREQYWLFSTPIFYDLFDKKILSKIQANNINSYLFVNSYGLEVSRLIYYDVRDIYTPAEFSMGFTRAVKSDNLNKLGMDYYKLAFTLNYLTLNISGRNGIFTWFKNYEQDELNRSYKWAFSFNKNIFNFNFNSIHKLYFYLEKENKTGFENDFNISAEKERDKLKTTSWTENFSFVYIFEGKKSLPKMLLAFFTEKFMQDEREEKLTISVFKERQLEKTGFKLAFKHTQKTKIGRNGEVKTFADISFASTKHDSILLNLTFGIAGKIEY